MNSYAEAESEMSLESRSFLRRVNDQVRKRQNQSSKDATKRQRQTFCDMENVYVFYIASICIHGEELLRQFAFHQNTEDLTIIQMFDISEKLITEQSDEIKGMNTINWGDSSRKFFIFVW